MFHRRTLLKRLSVGAASMVGVAVRAQDPSLITILVSVPGQVDFAARLVADQLRESLGRSVIVVSKLGAGGRLALTEVKRAPPNGRTLIFSASGPFSIYPNIYTRLEYDPVADFTPIAGVCWFDLGIAVAPQIGVNNVQQLVAWMKAREKEGMAYGVAPGTGSSSHFAGISIALATQIKMTPVAYKDTNVGMLDLIAGRIPILVTGLNPCVQMHKAGRIRLVAVSGDERSRMVPEIPTLKESGLNIVIRNSAGLFGPSQMPKELVAQLYGALTPMFSNEQIKEKMLGQCLTPSPQSGEALAATLVEDRKRYANLVRASGYTPEPI